jgi:farnesyl-diphosphate farnesyltransferase
MESAELGTDILKGVSRSFYLTLRLLPSGFREPMSLGYLLARLSDTIADAGTVEVENRREMLEQFRTMMSAPAKLVEARRFAQELPSQFEGAALPRGEWDLVLRAADCFEWLESMDRKVSRHIRKVVGIITEGQSWDLERFEGEGIVRVRDDEELELYAYRVAGSVGEFWTEVGFACQEKFSSESRHTLLKWGANYGKGLQLVNILRDLPEDLERGRCYLPGEGEAVAEDLREVIPRWQARARELLGDGFRYTATLHGVKLRAATGLPALLGVKTLDQLQAASWSDLERGVKISRKQVKWSLAEAFAMSVPGLPGSWRGIHRRTCQGAQS